MARHGATLPCHARRFGEGFQCLLARLAGGLLRSANAEGGDLTHYTVSGTASAGAQTAGEQKVNLTAALQGETGEDPPLSDGDVLTVPQQGRWKDIGASVTIAGEIGKPGVYGIRPGERLSSLLKHAGVRLRTQSLPRPLSDRTEQ